MKSAKSLQIKIGFQTTVTLLWPCLSPVSLPVQSLWQLCVCNNLSHFSVYYFLKNIYIFIYNAFIVQYLIFKIQYITLLYIQYKTK